MLAPVAQPSSSTSSSKMASARHKVLTRLKAEVWVGVSVMLLSSGF